MTIVSVDPRQGAAGDLLETFDEIDKRAQGMERAAQGYAKVIAQAFTGAVAGGKQFDDVLKSVALRLSNMAVQAALKPITGKVAGGIQDILGSLFGGIKPFAAGGVVGTPTYFPLGAGSLGVAGEAGPEAILPLSRGADGRLGVSAPAAASAPHITIQIATPDVDGFRRSEAYVAGQIARAVARGQRSL